MQVHEHDEQGRLVRTVTRSPWTAEDRVLMLARQMHHGAIHHRCGQPKAIAWHPEMDGWYETGEDAGLIVCHACTAIDRHYDPDAGQHELVVVKNARPASKGPLGPLPTPGVRRPRSR